MEKNIGKERKDSGKADFAAGWEVCPVVVEAFGQIVCRPRSILAHSVLAPLRRCAFRSRLVSQIPALQCLLSALQVAARHGLVCSRISVLSLVPWRDVFFQLICPSPSFLYLQIAATTMPRNSLFSKPAALRCFSHRRVDTR